jgi:hypothetical protein
MPAKQPIRKDPTTGMVCGRNHYLPEMLRSMPRLVKGSRPYLEWFEAEINAAGEPDVVLEAGVKRGDVLVLDYDSGDPFAADSSKIEYIGSDTFATELKAEEERERADQERKEAEEREKREAEIAIQERKLKAQEYRIKPWIDALQDPDSILSRQLRMMPKCEGEYSTRDGINYLDKLGLRHNGSIRYFDSRSDAIEVFHRAKDAGLIVFDPEEFSYIGADVAPIAA